MPRRAEESKAPTGRAKEGDLLVPQPHGGAVNQHPPGSNGNVHRGPDRFPRRNVMRAIIMKALSDPGVDLDRVTGKKTLEELWRTGRYRGKTTLAIAMCHHTAEALKAMAVRAALGNPQAMDQLLRFVHDAHDILQPAKDEEKKDERPIRPVFESAASASPSTTPDSASSAPASGSPAAPPPPPLTADGQVYE